MTLNSVYTKNRTPSVLEDSFFADFMTLSEEDKATVRAVVGVFGRGGNVATLQK